MTWNTETSHLKRWGSRHSWGICPAQSTRIAAKLSCSHCLWLLFSSLLVIHQTLSSGHSVFFLTLSYPLSSFYLSWACCFHLRPVPSHPPFQTQASCIWGLLVSLLLVSGLLLCSLFLFFFGDLPFFCLCLLFCFESKIKKNAVFPAILVFFNRGALIADTDKGFLAIRKMFCSFSPPPPQDPFFKTTLSLSFSLVFLFCLPFRLCFFCFVSLAWSSLLPLSFLRFCFVPSNQFPAIPFSNPPCFHFRSFRSSILPLCTLLFSGLAFSSFLFVLVFVWFFFLTVVVTSFSSLGVVFFVSLSVVFGCANVVKVVLVSAQGSFFKTTLGLSFSLIFASFSVFHFNIPRFCSWTQLLS